MTYVWPTCVHCGQPDKEGYMLKNEIWMSIATPTDSLHLVCAERLLGRQVRSDDFYDRPINNIIILLLKRFGR